MSRALSKIRKTFQLTQEELAILLDLHQSALARIESGDRKLPERTAEIVDFLLHAANDLKVNTGMKRENVEFAIENSKRLNRKIRQLNVAILLAEIRIKSRTASREMAHTKLVACEKIPLHRMKEGEWKVYAITWKNWMVAKLKGKWKFSQEESLAISIARHAAMVAEKEMLQSFQVSVKKK